MDKLISVIIPTFDRADQTNRAVASVTSARPDLVEIIVVDDCGSEIYRYLDRTNMHGIQVRVIRAEVNGGPGIARKIGVEQCLGTIVAFLDSDDTLHPLWIDRVIGELSTLDVSKGRRVMLVGQPNGSSTFIRFVSRVISVFPDQLSIVVCRAFMTMLNPFCTGTVVMSKDICHFHQSLRFCEDYYTNALAIFEADTVLILRDTIARYEYHRPGAKEGLSGRYGDMRRGEMAVKRHLLVSKSIPRSYRILVPFGILYMVLRRSAQSSLRGLLHIVTGLRSALERLRTVR